MSLYVNPYNSYDRDEFFEKKKEYEEYYGKESAFSKISKGLGSLFKK